MNLTRLLSGSCRMISCRLALLGGLLLCLCCFFGCRGVEQTETLSVRSDDEDGKWVAITLPGEAFAELTVSRSSETVSGAFSLETQFNGPAPYGLALVLASNGLPDPENFTSIMVERDTNGVPVVRIRNRVNGEEDVYDPSGVLLSAYEEKNEGHPEIARQMFNERYRHILDGNQYSVPFTNTTGGLRIHHDAAAGFLHFYYSVAREIRGKGGEGWLELTPAPDWGLTNESYFIVRITSGAEDDASSFSGSVSVTPVPDRDHDDTATGFAVTQRDFAWSGFSGEALVVTFGDEFLFRDRDAKLVFWALANYVPVWWLSNDLLYSYEFLETWGGGNRGCHEPMSDRLHRWTRVDVVEDNAVRKIIRWRYVLCNPDYKVPDDAMGTQLPEVEETYTCYPDGSVIRHMKYWPKLDGGHRKWVELAELICVAGSQGDPEDYLAKPALSLFSLDDGPYSLLPGTNTAVDAANRWEQVIADVHFANAPDAFIAFSNAGDTPQLHPGYRTGVNLSWHDVVYKMAHWPVGLEPYQEDDKTQGDWPMQISHTGLLGFGAFEGDDWESNYQTDERGRRYREWTAFVGLSRPKAYESIRNRVASWAYPGKVSQLEGAGKDGYFFPHGEFVLSLNPGATECRLDLSPEVKAFNVDHPVFRIENWEGSAVAVSVDGKPLAAGQDYRSVVENGNALIWINRRFDSPVSLTFTYKE